MKTVIIKCDACEKDLTYTGNCDDYFITVKSEPKINRGGAVTAMYIPDPVPQDLHFCGTVCLGKWAVK